MKTSTHLFSILIIAIAICLGPSYLQAAEYYVDKTNGSDSNRGTINSPWQRIAKANSTLTAGDTVFIRAGTYAETIRPANSGSSDNYITYTAYGNETVTIGGNITDAADLSDRTWIKIDGLNFTDTNHYWIEFAPNGSYNYISNNTFEATGSSMGWSGLHLRSSDHNKIINNSFSSACKPDDLVYILGGSYNLIEGNDFGDAAHGALEIQRVETVNYNIVRDNTFHNRHHGNLNVWRQAKHTLVEDNTIYDAGDDCGTDDCSQNSCGSDKDRAAARWVHAGIQVSANHTIIRNNVLINNGRFSLESWSDTKKSLNNRIYNNTFNENYRGWATHNDDTYPFSNNVIKNNIFSNNMEWNMDFCGSISETDNRFINNVFYGPEPVRYRCIGGLSQIKDSFPNEWIDNIQLDPGFKDADSGNLALRSDSASIDRGAWLTEITSSSGSGDSFTVADSLYFTDGFGIIPGDMIQIQNQNTTMRIISIDYTTHEIVVDRSVSWDKGNGVSLPFTGNAPDVGAFEYNSDLVPPSLFIVQK